MRVQTTLSALTLACFAVVSSAQSPQADALRTGFDTPPAEAMPRTWWHWVSGNISKEGITLDLEAMKRVGVAEAQVFNVDQGPAGPVRTLSPEWNELTKFAIEEAERIGVELAFQNCPGWSTSGGPWVMPQQSMQYVYWSTTGIAGGSEVDVSLPKGKDAPEYVDLAVLAFPTPPGDATDAKKPEGKRLTNARAKAGFEAKVDSRVATPWTVPAELIIPKDRLIDVTSRLSADGKLKWTAPAGNWTVLRIGHASKGEKNHPSVPEATGLEVDKLSADAVTAHFNKGYMSQVLNDAGPLAGRSLKYLLCDSWEAGSQNWTPSMRETFTKRFGYDPIPWLPVMTGRVVGSVDQSERFLWDLRRLIADLTANNHFGTLQKLAHQHGLQFYAEAPGIGMPCVADELQCKARTDIPMGEFWLHGEGSADVKEAASAAHINGKRWVAAESFTGRPEDASWRNDPYSIKALGDKHFCLGLNRVVFHRYAHQPFPDRVPGVTMGPWGLNFERTQTWWEPGAAWLKYIARCEWMLSQGAAVSDVLFFYGEWAPNTLPARANLKPAIPAGYDYDGCDCETLAKASVKDGNVVLPSGMTYCVLALAESDSMTPQTLAVVEKLVKAGATVVGVKPTKSPSLADYPKADAEVKRVADELWAESPGTTAGRSVGSGKVYASLTVADALNDLQLPPDFASDAKSQSAVMAVHRKTASGDLFFVSNQRYQAVTVSCAFRVSGKVPELWHPDTGVVEPVPVYREANGVTTIPLFFAPAGSVFVVFRDAPRPTDWVTDMRLPRDADAAAARPKVEIVKAVYQPVGKAGGKDVTERVRQAWKDDAEPLRVDNGTMGGDPLFRTVKELVVDYRLDGKPVHTVVSEGEVFALPIASWATPGVELRRDDAGRLKVRPWAAGEIDLTFASGKTWHHAVAMAAPVHAIDGAWDVYFPAGRGAPEKTTLDSLVSWTTQAESGVKYFSGTATYQKTIALDAGLLGVGKVIELDLGDVKNLAEVVLNGQNLGVLWKPPFRVDISRVAKAGQNQLEVKITNLWPNRLVGDEALPKEKRTTWTTFNPFKADSPLLQSGLLGPVTVRSTDELTPEQ